MILTKPVAMRGTRNAYRGVSPKQGVATRGRAGADKRLRKEPAAYGVPRPFLTRDRGGHRRKRLAALPVAIVCTEMVKRTARLLLWTVLLEGGLAFTHLALGTNKPWLWDCTTYGIVAGCTLYLAYWLEH
jgi:hypothetical protein